MRSIALVLVATTLAGCSTPLEPPARNVRAEARLAELIAGKTAGTPITCLPSYRSGDMVVIDENTIVFRQGASRVYVNRLQGGCNGLDRGWYALVTRTTGSSGLCRGDIAHVQDLANGFTVGSCAIGDFVPYTKAG